MSYVLDTNCVSALMRGDESVIVRLERAQKQNVAVPHPVLAEIAYGIERLQRSKRRESLSRRFGLIKAELPRAPWDDAVSEHFGAIKALLERRGERIEDFDAAIAAHALARGATLVTANLVHMARIPGLLTEDWAIG